MLSAAQRQNEIDLATPGNEGENAVVVVDHVRGSFIRKESASGKPVNVKIVEAPIDVGRRTGEMVDGTKARRDGVAREGRGEESRFIYGIYADEAAKPLLLREVRRVHGNGEEGIGRESGRTGAAPHALVGGEEADIVCASMLESPARDGVRLHYLDSFNGL